MVTGVVTEFWPEQGWGVIASDELPGEGIWVHYSVIEMSGYRAFAVGDAVEFEYEKVEQDGYHFRATTARPAANFGQ